MSLKVRKSPCNRRSSRDFASPQTCVKGAKTRTLLFMSRSRIADDVRVGLLTFGLAAAIVLGLVVLLT